MGFHVRLEQPNAGKSSITDIANVWTQLDVRVNVSLQHQNVFVTIFKL